MQAPRFARLMVGSLALTNSCGGISTNQTAHHDEANGEADAAHASDPALDDAGSGSGSVDAATADDSVSDGGPGVGAAVPSFTDPPRDPEDFCAAWQGDLMADNLRAVERFGLSWATSVYEGTLGAAWTEDSEDVIVEFDVERADSGWVQMEGIGTAVSMGRATYERLGAGARVLLGTTYSQPSFRDGVERAVWDSPRAIVPIEFADAEFTGYRAWQAQTVIVGHVVEHDGELFTVAVDEVLAGDFVRDSFVLGVSPDNLAPLPEPSDVPYLWSFTFDGATTDTLRDLRPATEQIVNRTREQLARAELHPVAQYLDAIPPLHDAAVSYRTASVYKGAPVVAVSEVTSNACCTPDSSAYAGETMIEALSGSGVPSTVTTAGPYRCGQQFVSAFGALEPSPDEVASWGCQETNTESTFSNPIVQRMFLTEENLASARAWVESARPIFRLHPADTVATLESFQGTDVPGMWSWPESFEFAFLAGARYQFIEIDDVVSTELGHEVTLTLSRFEPHTAKLFFRCGDERLLQKGSRWIAPFVHGFDDSIANGFLVPGVLFPITAEHEQALTGLRNAIIDSP